MCIFKGYVTLVADLLFLENNWYALDAMEVIRPENFVEGSFFKTLSQKYLIEIMGAEQELKSIPADKNVALKLNIKKGAPILHISVLFRTSRPDLNLYGDLYCNTSEYPIRNSYFL